MTSGERERSLSVLVTAGPFADAFGKLFLRKVVLVHELFHGVRRFDRVEILPLQVFDQRDLFDLAVGVFADDDGDLRKPRHFRRAVTAFARNDHVLAAFHVVDDDRHDHAVLFDGIGQLAQGVLIEMLARLVGVGADKVDIHLRKALYILGKRRFGCKRLFRRVLVSLLRIGKQSRKPPAQSSVRFHDLLSLCIRRAAAARNPSDICRTSFTFLLFYIICRARKLLFF